MNLEFNQLEIELLLEVLWSQRSALREEIYHTEAAGFKDELKRKKNLLAVVIDKIERSDQYSRTTFPRWVDSRSASSSAAL